MPLIKLFASIRGNGSQGNLQSLGQDGAEGKNPSCSQVSRSREPFSALHSSQDPQWFHRGDQTMVSAPQMSAWQSVPTPGLLVSEKNSVKFISCWTQPHGVPVPMEGGWTGMMGVANTPPEHFSRTKIGTKVMGSVPWDSLSLQRLCLSLGFV